MGLIAALRGLSTRGARTHLEAHGHRQVHWQLAPGRALTSDCRQCVDDAVEADRLAASETELDQPRRVPPVGFP